MQFVEKPHGIGYKPGYRSRLRWPILGLILMGLLSYIRNHRRRRILLSIQHDIPQQEDRDERRDVDPWLEDRLREDVRRYEDDLRELAKT